MPGMVVLRGASRPFDCVLVGAALVLRSRDDASSSILRRPLSLRQDDRPVQGRELAA